MEHTLNEIFDKVKNIKEEVDKIEFRVLSTKTHIDTVEKNMEKISRELIEGFHRVCARIGHLEEELKKVEELLANKK
ncbi:MAG: hypothetical protein ACP5Q5_05080 [Brevinematia bacterium]